MRFENGQRGIFTVKNIWGLGPLYSTIQNKIELIIPF